MSYCDCIIIFDRQDSKIGAIRIKYAPDRIFEIGNNFIKAFDEGKNVRSAKDILNGFHNLCFDFGVKLADTLPNSLISIADPFDSADLIFKLSIKDEFDKLQFSCEDNLGKELHITDLKVLKGILTLGETKITYQKTNGEIKEYSIERVIAEDTEHLDGIVEGKYKKFKKSGIMSRE